LWCSITARKEKPQFTGFATYKEEPKNIIN
jgi:hypothetical protein